jgi:nicotinamide-nucleotide amidase
MNAEIVSIGTELLLGEIVDTNAAYIARQLRTIGLDLYYKTTVGDNKVRCAEIIDHALGRADIVITTGGLGPTVDDITREAVARAVGSDLEFRPELLAQIEARFNRWGADMSENNRRQAFIPQGSIPIENPVGTAPCFVLDTARGIIISLPGVPREMEYLLENEVLPYLRNRFDLRAIIKTRVLRTAGLGESRIDTTLSDLLSAANPSVGLAAHPGQTDVRIVAKARSENEADDLIAPLEGEIRRRLGQVIYGTGDETVEEVLLRHLADAAMTISVAESGTGGLLTSRLSKAPGAEDIFRRGFVAADARALGRTLDVQFVDASPEQLESFSQRVAEFLTAIPGDTPTSRRMGLVVLTIPRVTDETATSAAGTIITVKTREGAQTRRLGYGGHAAHISTWATTYALELTRRWLLAQMA